MVSLPCQSRSPGTRGAIALAAVAVTAALFPVVADAQESATYTVRYGSKGSYAYPTDTPASTFIDKDGTFYFQQSASLYGANDPRYWAFFSGTNFDTATKNPISDAVNPNNSSDRNNNTTWRCNNSPTGVEATYAPEWPDISQRNFCTLIGVWVDPDTGHWYGLVHNEFTFSPFEDGSHYDAIDYAVSTDQGRTWAIRGHAITSPYSTKRGDTTAFPHQTYNYGAGDQRLFVDTASGYFYAYYGSRIVNKNGNWQTFYGHVARAPISGKMATGTWQKWYNGTWTEPGVGGKNSTMVPVTATAPTGYVAPSAEYSPFNTGYASEQIAAGKMPPTSPLFVMNIAYNAHLGLYIGTPQAVDQSGNAPQEVYATADLTTQKWTRIGDSGAYRNASWYRWFLDSVSKTGSTIVGKDYRSYCSIACGSSSGEYVNTTITSSTPEQVLFDPTKTYTIGLGSGRVLTQVSGSSATTSAAASTGSALERWRFTALGDGSYSITNASTGQLLGVGSTSTTTRAWGTKPTVTAGGPTVGQQWFVVRNTTAPGTYRLVNRYSGLVIALSSDSTRLAETTPARFWTNTTGNPVGGSRTAADQTLTIAPTAPTGEEVVTVTNPGAQTGNVGTPVTLRVSAYDSHNKPLTFTATGLPAGLSIDATGLITGTPTTAGTSSVTVTATSGTATGSTTFTWTIGTASLDGTRTVTTSGKALDNPGSSTTAGTQLITWSPHTGVNQRWIFTRQSDGTYTIANGASHLCVDNGDWSTTPGTKVIQWTCSGGANQRWRATRLANGLYTLANVHSGLLLTTASTSDGALVTQQTNTGSTLQQWAIS